MFIGGYKSGSDKFATVFFGRASFTDTGEGLPLHGREHRHRVAEVFAQRKHMPASNGVQRIGAFYCEAEKDGEIEQITTIIMAENSRWL